MKNKTIAFLGIGARLLCFMLIFSMLVCICPIFAEEAAEDATEETKPATVQVVKLIEDVNRGSRITKDDVEVITVKNVNVPSNVISNPEDVYSLYAKEDLYAGNYLSPDQLSESKVAKADNDLLLQPIAKSNNDYILVTDYVLPNTGKDLSTHIQNLINLNPRKTIYFPDGVYTIAYPLTTSGAGTKSVSLQLSDGAVIKAHADWRGSALICLGEDDHGANDIVSVGSYYCLMGGTLDGNSRANGVNIEGGRESLVRNICIKNAKTGIYIKKGVNNSSSDCDFEDITIVGDGITSEYGINIEACDNTLTNIRIYDVTNGLHCSRGGNLIKNVIIKNNNEKLKTKLTYGITGTADNWISGCYVENARTAFMVYDRGIIWDCTAVWTNNWYNVQSAFKSMGSKVCFSGCRADFYEVSGGRYVYKEGKADIEAAIVDTSVSAEGLDGVKIIPMS